MSEETKPSKKKKKHKKKTFKKWQINWTSDKIMSTTALFISVISLIALLYQSYLAREENKLIQKQQSASVLPYLNQWYSEYNEHFELIIGNKGVGPAFIKDVNLTIDSTKTFNNTSDFFNKIFKETKELDTIPYVTSTLISGFVLPANETIKIIELQGKNNINTFKQIVFNSMNISFSITYEDVYGAQWLLTNNNEDTNSTNVPVIISKND